MENILDRLSYYMKINGLNNNKVTVQAGLSNGLLGNAFKAGKGLSSDSIEKILCVYNDLNADWLLTGRGCMLNSNNYTRTDYIVAEDIATQRTDIDRKYESQEIPLYDISAAAGCVMLFQDSNNMVPIDTIKIPNLAKCDGAVFARGDSMYPIIKSGDIILYKALHGLDYIIWGETYIVCYEAYGDYFTVVKYVKKSTEHDGNLVLLSHNEHHQPFEIHISQVKSMALVRASVRYNNM